MLWTVLLLAALFSSGPLERSFLAVPGRVSAVIPADVDGDGAQEVLVFWREGYPFESVARLSIYGLAQNGVNPAPRQVLALPKNAVAFDVGDVNADQKADLLLLQSDGLWALPGTPDGTLQPQPIQLIKIMTVAAFPNEDHLPRMRLLTSLDEQGRQGMLLPTVPIGPMTWYERDPEGVWTKRQVLRVPTRSRLDTAAEDTRAGRDVGAAFQFYYPRLVAMDQNGDGRRDLIFLVQDSAAVFRQRPDGGFPSEPDLWRNFGILSPKERVKVGVFVRGEAGDVNGDGRADLFFNRSIGGISNMKSEVRLFLAQGDGNYLAKPDFARSVDGYGASAHLADVDNDGKSDLVLPYVQLGLSEMVRMMLVSRIDVEFQVHLARQGLWNKEPDIGLMSPFGINFRSAQELTGSLPVFGQDFNGDGLPDAVVSVSGGGSGENPDRLEIRAGKKPFGFDSDIWHVDLPATRNVQPFHPRQGDPPGLIIFFSQVAGKEGDVWLFLNNKKW